MPNNQQPNNRHRDQVPDFLTQKELKHLLAVIKSKRERAITRELHGEPLRLEFFGYADAWTLFQDLAAWLTAKTTDDYFVKNLPAFSSL